MSRYFAWVSWFALLGCSAGGGTGMDGGGGRPDVMAGPENTIGACRDGVDNDGDGLGDCDDPDCRVFAVCTEVDSGPGIDGFMECAGEETTADNADAPVDIIWVVDSSNSMENDASVVQSNLMGFASYIESRSIDFHVVMITDRGFVTPSPLFMTDPRFLFVDRGVGSNDAFDRVLDQFPVYSGHLRPTALTHVIGVTDDDEDMAAGTFISRLDGLLGHGFTYHAIASEPGDCPIPICGCSCGGCQRPGGLVPAADEGTEHWAAAGATGGMTFSICTSNWSMLFDTLARTVAVSVPLPCVYLIPPPPAGMSFNRDQVNVEHTPAGATVPTVFPRAPNEAGCVGNAWYYDDPEMATRILLCPDACTTVTSGAGTVNVRFGCGTQLI